MLVSAKYPATHGPNRRYASQTDTSAELAAISQSANTVGMWNSRDAAAMKYGYPMKCCTLTWRKSQARMAFATAR